MEQIVALLIQNGPIGIACVVLIWVIKNSQADRQEFLTRLDALNTTMAKSQESFIRALATLQAAVDNLQSAQTRLATSMDEMSRSLFKLEAAIDKEK